MVMEKKSEIILIITYIDYVFIGTNERHHTATVYRLTMNTDIQMDQLITPAIGTDIPADRLKLTRDAWGTDAN